MKRNMKVEIYCDKKKEWRWRFISSNGKTIADSSEGYKRRYDCARQVYKIGNAFIEGKYEVGE